MAKITPTLLLPLPAFRLSMLPLYFGSLKWFWISAAGLLESQMKKPVR